MALCWSRTCCEADRLMKSGLTTPRTMIDLEMRVRVSAPFGWCTRPVIMNVDCRGWNVKEDVNEGLRLGLF